MTNRPETLYISGPIRGIEKGNRPDFARAAQHLAWMGFKYINPHELLDDIKKGKSDPAPLDIRTIMLRDIEALATNCHGIFMLPGWQKSLGAMAEYYFALATGMPVWGEDWYDESNSEPFQCLLSDLASVILEKEY